MKGTDVSHYQGNIDWKKYDLDFAILKATQGVAMVDNFLAINKREARRNDILLGFYHFANGGDAKKEANFFVKTVGDLHEGEFYVLDFEIQIANIEDWCKIFLNEVYEKTGIRPLIYVNSATAKSVDFSIIGSHFGLWIANYGANDGKKGKEPAIGAFPCYVIWQYTSNGTAKGITGRCDLNYCPYSIEVLKKYGKPKEVEVSKTETIPTRPTTEDVQIPVTITNQSATRPAEPVAQIEEPVQVTPEVQTQLESLKATEQAEVGIYTASPNLKVEKTWVNLIVEFLKLIFKKK